MINPEYKPIPGWASIKDKESFDPDEEGRDRLVMYLSDIHDVIETAFEGVVGKKQEYEQTRVFPIAIKPDQKIFLEVTGKKKQGIVMETSFDYTIKTRLQNIFHFSSKYLEFDDMKRDLDDIISFFTDKK